MHQLKIIISSTRPGRKGPAIAEWILHVAQQHKEFEIELIDLAALNLPLMDEPFHPILQKYMHQHTMDWSKKISAADAFIIVTPEYNYSFPAPLKNAFDFLSREWGYKPVAFVSYGGVAAGTRAVQAFKQVVTALKMVPLTESINIPFFTKHLNEAGTFMAEESLNHTADAMLHELLKWTVGLKAMRAASSAAI